MDRIIILRTKSKSIAVLMIDPEVFCSIRLVI